MATHSPGSAVILLKALWGPWFLVCRCSLRMSLYSPVQDSMLVSSVSSVNSVNSVSDVSRMCSRHTWRRNGPHK